MSTGFKDNEAAGYDPYWQRLMITDEIREAIASNADKSAIAVNGQLEYAIVLKGTVEEYIDGANAFYRNTTLAIVHLVGSNALQFTQLRINGANETCTNYSLEPDTPGTGEVQTGQQAAFDFWMRHHLRRTTFDPKMSEDMLWELLELPNLLGGDMSEQMAKFCPDNT